jgi:hypothetical protein
MLRGIKFGWKSIRQNLREQLGELASDATKEEGVAGESDRETYPSVSLITATLQEDEMREVSRL